MNTFLVTPADQSLHIRMAARLENIDRACAEAKTFLQHQCLQQHAFAVQLVMREALANAVIHGSGSDPANQVTFSLNYDGRDLVMRVSDQGPGFSWSQVPKEIPCPDCPGGRGVSIMRQYFDEVSYNERGNAVVLTKRCPREACMSDMQHSGESVVVKPGRDIVSSMAQDFKTELKELVDQGIKDLTIDLDGVEMIDSIGMGLLIAAHNSLTKNGGRLRVVNSGEDILRLLRTMRLDKHFEVVVD